jgi:uncharacterized protein DUF4331
MKTITRLFVTVLLGGTLFFIGCGDDDEGGEAEAESESEAESEGETPQFADLTAATQVDRMGKPAINTAAIPSGPCDPLMTTDPSCKADYNRGTPDNDLADFAGPATAQLSGPDADPAESSLWAGGLLTDAEAGTIAGVVWSVDGPSASVGGDVLVLDTSGANGYTVAGGGRSPDDDVIDTTLDAITLNSAAALNSAGVATDNVSANDSVFKIAFPYFAAPH